MSDVTTRVWSLRAPRAERATSFRRFVYAWMFVGLAIAAAIASTPIFVQTVGSNLFLILLRFQGGRRT